MRRWWRAVWREVVGFAIGFAAAWVLVGWQWWACVIAGVAVVVGVVVGRRLPDEDEPRWERERRSRRDGARSDLQDLAWAMVGRDGRTGERTQRRVREIAAVRLARHGVDLADPAQAAAARELLGQRAHAAILRRQSPLPTLGDLRHTITVLERIGPGGGRPTFVVRDLDAPPDENPAPSPDRRTA